MSMPDPIVLALQLAAGLVLGGAVGAAHFGALRASVGLIVEGGAMRALLLQLARFAGTGVALAGIALWLGAWALLAAAAGIGIARVVMLRRGVRPGAQP